VGPALVATDVAVVDPKEVVEAPVVEAPPVPPVDDVVFGGFEETSSAAQELARTFAPPQATRANANKLDLLMFAPRPRRTERAMPLANANYVR
jgi:hypothetical protein